MADPCRLYLITPPRLEPNFSGTLARTLDAGDVACLQLRLADTAEDQLRASINQLLPITQSRGVALLLNNNPVLAAELGCDGVHIGQDDVSCEQARKTIGVDGVIGISCRASRHLAIEAAERGADYVAFGAEPDILQWWHEVTTVPAVATGGITVENCPALVRTGVEFIAVAAGVWDYPQGPAAAVVAFNDAIASTLAS